MRTKPQETFENILNEQKENFLFNHPMNSFEGVKWELPVTRFEATNSVFVIVD